MPVTQVTRGAGLPGRDIAITRTYRLPDCAGRAFDTVTESHGRGDPEEWGFAAGDEPFEMITAAVAALEPGEDLVVLAPSEPVPLEGVLSSHGFSYEAKPLDGDDWQVTFRQAH